jgi:hypothetical protein
MLGRFDRLRRDEFELDDAEYGQLRAVVRRWHELAVELSRGQSAQLEISNRYEHWANGLADGHR